MSLSHLFLVLVILLLFGNRRLPGIGRALGRGIGAFRRSLTGR